MVVLTINGFNLTGRFENKNFDKNMEGSSRRVPTVLKRQFLISAFQQMPDSVVDEIWERALREEPRLELLPLNDTGFLSEDNKE